jgi:hypothetical protein
MLKKNPNKKPKSSKKKWEMLKETRRNKK